MSGIQDRPPAAPEMKFDDSELGIHYDLTIWNHAACAEALLNHGSKNVMLNITEQGEAVCDTQVF